MILIEGWVRTAPEDIERLRPAAIAMVRATKAEPGCLEYAFTVDLADPGLLRVIERWTDQAALDAHFAAPHMAVFGEAMAGMRIEAMLIKAYDGREVRTLMER